MKIDLTEDMKDRLRPAWAAAIARPRRNRRSSIARARCRSTALRSIVAESLSLPAVEIEGATCQVWQRRCYHGAPQRVLRITCDAPNVHL